MSQPKSPRKSVTPEEDNPVPAREVMLFDMDGVLVDVRNSYRKAIQETIRYFTGKSVTSRDIQEMKEKGGYNNDWDLTEALILKRGQKIKKQAIIDKFQKFYLGSNCDGFILNEKWLISIPTLRKISQKYLTGIVTGRPREEALFVLRRFNVENLFTVVVCMEDYPPEKAKPDPFPIQLALKKIGGESGIYVGDSVDDVTSAKHAGLRAIGCFPPGLAGNKRLTILFQNAGAEKIIDCVNDVENAL